MRKIILSSIISILILFFIFFKLDWSNVWEVIVNADLKIVLLALIIQISIIFLLAIRWSYFFKQDGIVINPYYILRLTFIGAFFNNILPSSTGGDAVRGYYIYKNGYSAANAFSPIINERIIGLVTTLAMAAFFIQFISIEYEWFMEVKFFIPLIFLISLVGVILISIPVSYNFISKLLNFKKSYRLVSALLRIIEATYLYFNKGKLMIKVCLISTILHIVAVTVVWLLALSVGANISFLIFFAVTPIIFVISGIPITIGGLGLREGVMITVFTAVGMDYYQAASLSIYFVFILLFASLPGFILFLFEKSNIQIIERINVSV